MKPAISRIVLGTDWMIAVPNSASWNIVPAKRADAILHQAVELGINSFETARIYRSEGVIGRFVKKHPLGRDAFWIITKGGRRLIRKKSLTQHNLLRELDDSLRALATDYVDVYLLHYDDPTVLAQAIADWSLKILRSGKARNIGYSNVSLARLKELQIRLQEANVVPWVSNEFNAISPQGAERWKGAQNISRDRSFVDYLRENDLPFLAYSPLGRGDMKRNSGELRQLLALSKKYDVPPAAIALNYILQTAPNFRPIVGTSSLHHLHENVRALQFQMTDGERDALAFPNSSPESPA